MSQTFGESNNSRVIADQYLLKQLLCQIISFVGDATEGYYFLNEIQQKCVIKHYSKLMYLQMNKQ